MMGAMMGGGMGMGVIKPWDIRVIGNPGLWQARVRGYPQITSPMASAVACRAKPGESSKTKRSADLTGSYLGNAPMNGQGNQPAAAARDSQPRSTTRILIQGTPQEYEQILGLLRQLDMRSAAGADRRQDL